MASAWWPISTAVPTTTSWTAASPSWSAWPTAAPRARRSTPATAPASWCRSRTASWRPRRRRRASRCPTRAGTRSASSSSPPTPTTRCKARTVVEHTATEEGLTVLGWRTVPTETGDLGQIAFGRHAAHPAGVRRPVGSRRRHHGARAARLRAAQAGRARRRRRLLPVAVGPHHRLQGHAHLRAAAPVLPRPARPHLRVGPGARALPLLDQHVPQLAAGPPVPLPLPQRRDQHAGRQPQLDAGPRGAARDVADRRGPVARSTRSARRRRATRPASTRCSSCCISAGARCRTPC